MTGATVHRVDPFWGAIDGEKKAMTPPQPVFPLAVSEEMIAPIDFPLRRLAL